ncbi:MAG: bile acid:sodium symporter family protein [Gammaproteobacteria bacterium]|nr:bile acid:sodium symporter family protein [Gammaproteobacteria bacterium]
MSWIVTGFPLLAIIVSIIAARYPEFLIGYKPAIIPLLGIVMFAMGMTLTLGDFKRVLKSPKVISLGLLLQYGLMPLLAFIIAIVLGLPTELMAGLILVGACPGGTASNVICYLGRGDVALSITLTAISTLLAVFLTPVLTWLYIGQEVPVPIINMMLTVLKIIILPVMLGIIVNSYFGEYLTRIKQFLPVISVIAIVFIIAIIVALNAHQIVQLAFPIIIAVLLHNGLGLVSGYAIAKWLGYDDKICRTLAIEVGMQNSGLGVALATKYFTTLTALPGAFFSIWHNITGSLLAAYWTSKSQHAS